MRNKRPLPGSVEGILSVLLAAQNENIPILLFGDLETLVEKVSSEYEADQAIARAMAEGVRFSLAWTLENEIAVAMEKMFDTEFCWKMRYLPCFATSGSEVGITLLCFIAEGSGKGWPVFSRKFAALTRSDRLELPDDRRKWNELKKAAL